VTAQRLFAPQHHKEGLFPKQILMDIADAMQEIANVRE